MHAKYKLAPMSARPTERLLEHIADSRIDRWQDDAIAACKTFVLDSLGVALSGTRVPQVKVLCALTANWGAGHEARVIGSGERTTLRAAAFLNSYQIHNQEWDAVHEPAVVHPMAVVLACLLAWSEKQRGVSGQAFINACCLAVDVATTIGAAAHNKLRFFRPAMCGALGAAAGMARLAGLTPSATHSALGLTYSQLSGTMQAHLEGSPMLPMQIGFNARAAIDAIELAQRGIQGPLDFLEGPFGYFTLIDPDWDPNEFESLGRVAQVTRLSHKPFPSGRATHGGVDGTLTLMAELECVANDIERIHVYAPPLVRQLVDRTPRADMTPSYARLCLPYVVATAALQGTVNVEDFTPQAIATPARLELAARVHPLPDGNPAPNALVPQRVTLRLRDGREAECALPAVLGSPDKPLSQEQHLTKFRRAAHSGLRPLPLTQVEGLIQTVDKLEHLADISKLFDQLVF